VTEALRIRNCGKAALGDVPCLSVSDFRTHVIDSVGRGESIASLFAAPLEDGYLRVFAVMASHKTSLLSIACMNVKDRYPSLTPDCPQAHLFEREMAEQWQMEPIGHPWLKPVRFQPSLNESNRQHGTEVVECGVTKYFSISGEEIHEVAVGPVHAGVIEPGHFRFQCHGETVHHLEISLGYQHRGIERTLVGEPNTKTLSQIQTLSGDTTIAHSIAYCGILESLTQCLVPQRADAIRGIAQELERLANHVGDLGALAADIGFLPTQSYCGRIRGDILNITAEICGNRFGRGLVRPGGVHFDIVPEQIEKLQSRLASVQRDTQEAVNLLWGTPSVLARFEGTGVLDKSVCEELGFVGVAARACDIARDVRKDFPYGMFQSCQIPTVTWNTGEIFARAMVRWLEVQQSFAFVREQLGILPTGSVLAPSDKQRLLARHIAISLTEGWRGEICHVAITDGEGRLLRYKIVDPSFHNWFALAYAMRDEQISDFPLCNKSFNLSYCGHDL